MNVKVENVEKNVVRLEIEVDASTFEEGMNKSYRKNAGRFSVPGFRKGKVPRKIVERYYGEQVLYEDAINFICPEAYEQAIKGNNIHPVSEPEIDIVQIGSGQNFIFTAKVTVKPEVELGEYLGIEVKKDEVNVTDEDVEKELKMVAERNARLVNIDDRGIQEGDIAVIDYEGFIDDRPFEGGKAVDYYLEIGSGNFIPGFEEQLAGAKTGDEIEVKVTFPGEYRVEELAGKDATFKVKVKGIKVKEIPAIDDEFAKDVSEFDTIEEYRKDMKNKIIEREELIQKRKIEDEIVKKVVENSKVDIPQVMVDKRIDRVLQELGLSLYYRGLSLESYMKATGKDINKLREEYRDEAYNDVKTQIVLEKIIEVENIAVAEEDLDEEIRKLAGDAKKSYEEYKKLLSDDDIEYIRRSIQVNKAIEFLVKNAKFV
ncbi:MAG: trigger factor [Clostridiaceae bacterium]|nr:trigger factor [Clostridiaceae bacterium]